MFDVRHSIVYFVKIQAPNYCF